MLFTSCAFIAFVLAGLLIYYLLPRRSRWVVLLAESGFFYACAGPKYLLVIGTVTAVIYYAACRIGSINEKTKAYLKQNRASLSREERKAYKEKAAKPKNLWFYAALTVSLGILAVIKYTDFAISSVNALFGTQMKLFAFALPMGISFYTFQAVGYLIDVWHDKQQPQRNFARFALFVSFFPQLVQGPISRYGALSETLFSGGADSKEGIRKDISFGLQRAAWGFFKKLIVADRLLPAVKALVAEPELFRGGYVILLMVIYAAQLYADFTGGIDITIGVAEMFGVHVTENFDHPFLSKDTAEYWRRWHITMGTWFRDYIFYPLSVSKPMRRLSEKGRKVLGTAIGRRLPVYVCTIIVWFVTGLWHGAGWNFIVWGLLNCLVLLVSQECTPLYEKFHRRFHVSGKPWYSCFQIVRTFFLMSAIRILDCYRDVGLTFRQYGSVFTKWQAVPQTAARLGLSRADECIVLLGCGVMIAVSLLSRDGSLREKLAKKPAGLRFVIFWALFMAILIFGAYGVGFDSAQFIYNQF